MLPQIAFIGTGGTIASLGSDPFDLLDYNSSDTRVDAAEIILRTGLQSAIADIVPIDFRQIDSTAILVDDWADLIELCNKLARDTNFKGIVIGHGTASLEETAWLLSLVLDLPIAVVVTGSMRPLNGLSSDAASNLASAIKVASVASSGMVLVVINDEIHTARSVTKNHTSRLNAFQSPWLGPIGTVAGLDVRLPNCERRRAAFRFGQDLVRKMPRIDIVYSYVGADGTAIRAFALAGAKGIIAAGFGPGMGTPAETCALAEAVMAGTVVIQSSRTGGGHVVDSDAHRKLGIIPGGDLSPQKARILLGLCLSRGDTRDTIRSVFEAI